MWHDILCRMISNNKAFGLFLVGAACGAAAAVLIRSEQSTDFRAASAVPIKIGADSSVFVDKSNLQNPKLPNSNKLDTKSREALRLRAEGVAVLDVDIPVVQRLRQDIVAKSVAEAMALRGKEYESLFRRYGLDESSVKRMLGHVSAIFEARIELQNNATQLFNARDEYRNELRALLGSDYSNYEKYESFDSARREVASIESAAVRYGMQIPDEERDSLMAFVSLNGIYTDSVTNGHGGVFQDWNRPMDRINTVGMIEKKLDAIDSLRKDLKNQAIDAKLGESTTNALDTYYEESAKELRSILKRFTALPEDIQALRDNARKSRGKATP